MKEWEDLGSIFLVPMLFISIPIYYFLLSTNLGFVLLFLIPWGIKLICLFEIFLVSWYRFYVFWVENFVHLHKKFIDMYGILLFCKLFSGCLVKLLLLSPSLMTFSFVVWWFSTVICWDSFLFLFCVSTTSFCFLVIIRYL